MYTTNTTPIMAAQLLIMRAPQSGGVGLLNLPMQNMEACEIAKAKIKAEFKGFAPDMVCISTVAEIDNDKTA